ncbi:MAG: hypothetical protein Q9188_003887 [Gyalolechia gomerana]
MDDRLEEMNVSKRVSSAPLFSSQEANANIALSCASTDEASEKPRTKLPRSPGFLNNDSSLARLEFQDSKRSMDELKEFARTTPPAHPSPQPIFGHPLTASLSRTDSGRRRRILEHIADSGNLPSKPLKRLLYRLNRSATTSDLTLDTLARGGIEVASKESSSGRKYKKIAFNPKLYESDNSSTYKVNFQDLKAKGEAQKWIRRKSKQRGELENDASEVSGQTSRILDDTDDHCKKVKDEYPDLIAGSEVPNRANNGYSPSKGIPKPELGPNVRDFAAATLAIAQAHARRAGQVSTSPERRISQSRQHGSPVRNHGNHASRRSASFKGPYSVPIKFQMRPQRASLPKTPRTSLDEPSTLKETSPVVNGKAKASSTFSASDSLATDGQSDAESGEIMNAQSAELIHGQGIFGYHTRTSQKPPRSGPAPTRALPSLPEGFDSMTPEPAKVEKYAPSASTLQLVSEGAPKPKMPKSPPKGHRYRLSPVKNNIRKDASAPVELKPSPRFTEEFPRPPRGLLSTAPDNSTVAVSPRRNREADAGEVLSCVRNESSGLTEYRSGDHQETANDTKVAPNICDYVRSEHLNTLKQQSTDHDKDYLYLPWQESRVERVRALKGRDVERLRSHQENPISQSHTNESTDASANVSISHEGALVPGGKNLSKSQSSPILVMHDLQLSKQMDSRHGEDIPSISSKYDFSPIVTIAEEPPYMANHLPPGPFHLRSLVEGSGTWGDSSTEQTTRSLPLKANGMSNSHLHIPSHTSSIPHPNIHRTSSDASKAGRSDPSSTSRPHSHSHSSTSDLEARIASLEKKNLLLKRAFMAVIDASSDFALANLQSGNERDTCSVEEDGEKRRASAVSEVSAPLVGRVEGMLRALQWGEKGRMG